MDNHILQIDDIEDCFIIVDILPKCGYVSNIKIEPKYITIHDTNNLNMPATIVHKNVKHICTKCIRRGHTQFIVDDECIYQSQIANIKCFHTGTKVGNESSIGIEICVFRDKERQRKSYENTIKLIKVLMEYYNIKMFYPKVYAWFLKDVQRIKEKRYRHPKGAVIWVKDVYSKISQ